MCGGTLDINPGDSIAVCDYCGTKQTLPKLDDDKRANMYDRANHFRRNNEYDKAMGIYEQILNEDNTDAEAYWSIVLCRYGIEYVEDPATHNRIPTVNRAQYTSIFDDDNYKSALQYASAAQHDIYVQEATAINEIQKGILAISQKEEPFDVFICYKETDKDGRRTPDSVLANDLYHQLTNEGFKVFFSRITLEDKLGTAYEPYIFAALNSAKVMVVLGTKPEYFNAVWVKNEWSRYLSLIKNGANKILIPAYRDMDPYDLPEEFSHLQAQDMSKLGFMQDLIRGIKKLTEDTKQETVVKETKVISESASIAPLLKRTALFLEDGNWQEANRYCERVLDLDPENALAYLYKLMAKLRVRTVKDFFYLHQPFDRDSNYRNILRFADKELIDELKGYNAVIRARNAEAKKESIYNYAVSCMQTATDVNSFLNMAKDLDALEGYKDSAQRAEWCRQKAQELIRIAEERKAEQKRLEEESRIAAKKKNKKLIIFASALAVVFLSVIVLMNFVIIPAVDYNIAVSAVDNGDYGKALSIFTELGEYSDAKEQHDKIMTELQNIAILNCGSISTDSEYTVALKADGTVVAVGENIWQYGVSKWTDIVAVSSGTLHTVALKADGTVVAVGNDSEGQCDVSGWIDIVAVSAGDIIHTVGLKTDGTVVAVGKNDSGQCDVSGWTDIAAVSAGAFHTVGLKTDGTVVAVGKNASGQCDVSRWVDIVSVSAGTHHTVGLKSDGTVVAVGANAFGQCDVSEWTDIVAISAGVYHTVGLKADGTVVAVGANSKGQCNVSKWTDIVAVSAGSNHTVGLKADGTVVAVGDNSDGQCNVSDWTDIAVKTE